MSQVNVLIKETPESVLGLLPPGEDTEERRPDIYEPDSRLSSDTESSRVLTMDFPASRTVRNECLLFISHSTSGVLLQQSKWLRDMLF